MHQEKNEEALSKWMDAMSTPKRTDAAAELGRLEDALVDSILDASETEMREEIVAVGEDPDVIVRRIDALLVAAKAECAVARLRRAQDELRAFRTTVRSVTSQERDSARVRFEAARSCDRDLSAKLLLAARNGRGATERDMDSLIEDIAELERLKTESGENS
jgi:hypothetical protein